MAEDTKYVPVPYVYQSIGLVARPILDRAPAYSYLDMQNCLEREESSMSSRFGTQVINRDPVGFGTSNHFFTASPVSLARFYYQGSGARYAGLSDGTLWERVDALNMQGAYTQIYSGLSGVPFESLITSCYETSLPYLFIYDEAVSIKAQPSNATVQLTGIDPPAYTVNSVPYSPLLTLIDNFASSNSYTTSGFDGSWSYASVTTITANNAQTISDFYECFDIGSTHSVAGTTQTVSASGYPSNNFQTYVISGFPSIVLASGQVVTVTVPASASAVISGSSAYPYAFNAFVHFEYSIDGGVTFSNSIGAFQQQYGTAGTYTLPNSPYTWVLSVVGLSNLDQLAIQMTVVAAIEEPVTAGTLATTGTIGTVTASLQDAGAFADICNGILSNRFSNPETAIPIVSIVSADLVNGLYQNLLITTASPHGITLTEPLAVYGSSNDLVDGFYFGTVSAPPSPTTLKVQFPSAVAVSATGGTLSYYAAGEANYCILSNQYSTPYPTQMSVWGFYSPANLTLPASFPIGAWSGKVDTNSTASVAVTADFDLSQNNQVNDYDLIVLTLNVTNPANILNIQLAFDVNNSGYTSSYYYANISPAYYQGNIAGIQAAYQSTQNQILADALGVIAGQPIGSTTAQLQPSNFSTGSGTWQAVLIPRGNFLPVGNAGQSGIDWTNITGWKITIETTADAITGDGSSVVACNGLYLQWGYGPSSFAGVGYDYRVTYYNANTGTESNGSPIQWFNQQWGYLSSLKAPFYLRQAAQITGYYSADSQVTHLRVYRRGGTYAGNWYQIDQAPNITGGGIFYYKDVIPDSSLQQAKILQLDNDPPVTSSLVNPIQTTLSAATSGPGSTYYSTFAPQLVTVVQADAVFVPEQVVLIGNPTNLEECLIVAGGTGQFSATLRIQHNAGEPVICYSTPRSFCDICCLGNDGTVYLAGDKNNPQRIYRSKPNNPEAFGPQFYTDIPSSDDAVMGIINWRGTIVAATLKTFYLLPGGNARPVPTGAAHGLVAKQGWTLSEGGIQFQASDGMRFFTGADGNYMTLPVEWIFRGNPLCIPPQLYQDGISQSVLAFYNNCVHLSYESLNSPTLGVSQIQVASYRIFTFTIYYLIVTFSANVPDQTAPYTFSGLTNYTALNGQTITGTTSLDNGLITPAANQIIAAYGSSLYGPAADTGQATTTGPGQRYRLIYDTIYKRFRYDDIPATAMLWEKDTNAFVVAKQMSPGNYAVVQDWVGDYDDGGWVSGVLTETEINLSIQSPYLDLNEPHNPKNWISLETDVNTQGQSMATQLFFDDGTIPAITLPPISTTQRTKVQNPVTPVGANEGSGQQAYRASIKHTISVTVAPILYQENIYSAVLAPYRYTFDTYWILGGTDLSKRCKQILWDYTSAVAVDFSIFADGSTTPYYTFTLPAAPNRAVIRTRFPALSMRTFRMTGNISSGQSGFQAWAAPQLWWKPCLDSAGYQQMDLVV